MGGLFRNVAHGPTLESKEVILTTFCLTPRKSRYFYLITKKKEEDNFNAYLFGLQENYIKISYCFKAF